MNPTVKQRIIDEAFERDPAVATSEYMAEFRSDLASVLSREALDHCVDDGVLERSYSADLTYFAFADPSGGSSDSFTLAIAHAERDIVFVDCVREVRAPLSPAVTAEFAAIVKSYKATLKGDTYGGTWPRERFLTHGVQYQTSVKNKSELYLETLQLGAASY
jgi:hypothetical protein